MRTISAQALYNNLRHTIIITGEDRQDLQTLAMMEEMDAQSSDNRPIQSI